MFFWSSEILPGTWGAFTDTGAGNLALHVGDAPAEVVRRRRNLEQAMGIDAGALRFMNQTHSTVAAPVDGAAADAPVSADALVSADGGTPLAVMVADCVPVILAGGNSVSSDAGAATAVVHAGRRGVLGGIVGNTVDLMRRHGAADLRAWIGPAICGSCYEVPDAMRDEVAAAVPAAWTETRWGTPGLDLPAAAAAQLQALGVAVQYVADPAALCTLENSALYSHRRSPASGRLAGLVWRP